MLYLTALVLIGLASVDSPAPKQCNGAGATKCASVGDNCLDIKNNGVTKEVCTKCEDTHVPIEGACQEKAAQADKCTPQDPPDGTCKACLGSHYLYAGGCYAACPDGTYADAGACKPCGASCVKCEKKDAGTRCTKCEDTHVPIEGACQEKAAQADKCTPQDPPDGTCKACLGSHYLYAGGCYAACPDGTYADAGACKPCGASCVKCEKKDAGTRCTKCEDTHVPIEGACQEKAAQADKCTPQDPPDGTCKACLGSHYLYAGGCYAACPDGTYADAGACKPCGASCVKCEKKDAGTRCTKCEDTHVPIEGACQEKAAQADKCTPQDPPDGTCKACLGSHYLYAGGCYAACPDGTYADAGACKPCGASCVKCEKKDAGTRCTKCEDTHVPIEGACQEKAAQADKCTPQDPPDGTCKACLGSHYLYAGGCYAACPDGTYADAGACKPCGASCVKCEKKDAGTRCTKCEDTHVPIEGACQEKAAQADKCTPQDPPDGTCKACLGSHYLYAGGCYAACPDGTYADAGACKPCGASCVKCEKKDAGTRCTKCEDTHVPIEGACQEKAAQADKCTPQDPPDGTCKACLGSHYLYAGGCYAACPDGTYADAGACKPCGASCVKCEKKDAGTRCTKCEDTHVPIEGACQEKAAQADKCTPQDPPDGTCKACLGSHYLYAGGCYAACPDGTYADAGACKPCGASCVKCEKKDAGTRCTKCEDTHVPIEGACQEKAAQADKCTPQDPPDGTCKACLGSHYLYAGGCYAACPDGTYADAGACKPCGASCVKCEKKDAGTRCTKCEDTHVPIEGACQEKAAQADKCTPQDPPDGTCKACKGGSYLYKGGCYASCPQGTPNPETNTCDGVPAPDCNIPNCKSCPDGTCTECNDGFVLGDGNKCVASSVNKSGGLSTGAIAGISVAVVIVVGGLVGFLCWWFICRGKA